MKQVTNMSRLVNQLEKMFRELNADMFNNELDTPIITVSPSSRSYAHYTPWNAWEAGSTHRREINIASGTLDRPLEAIAASLLHEMVHMYNDSVLNIQDTSRGGTYHNKAFARACEQHGLICTKTDKYGWSHTEPSDMLLEWLLNHNELKEVEMCRITPTLTAIGVGAHTASGGIQTIGTNNGHHRKYVCPRCGNSVRATKTVNIMCMDCSEVMTEI